MVEEPTTARVVRSNKKHMLILIYGEDSYRCHKKVKQIISGYQEKNSSGLNLCFADTDLDFTAVSDTNRQSTMFDEKRLFVVKNPLSTEKTKEGLLKHIDSFIDSENIILLHQEGSVRKNDKLINRLSKVNDNSKAMLMECPLLPDDKALQWIKKEFQSQQVEITDKAVASLYQFAQKDSWRIKNEIDKLSLYSKKITEEDVLKMVSFGIGTDIFKTIEAFSKRDLKNALIMIRDHLRYQENIFYLLAMITHQFRVIATIRDLIDKQLSYQEAKTKSGLHPFVFGKSFEQAKQFSAKEIKAVYSELLDIDSKAKKGQIDPVLAVDFLLFKTLL